MRNRRLHAALAAFAEESAWQLASDVARGDDLPFEIVVLGRSPARRGGVPLSCYRPLTADFIERRASILGRLPSYVPALDALAACGGLDAYLVARGDAHVPPAGRPRAQEALHHFLARVFADSTDFVLEPDRLHRAYDELEALVMDGRTVTDVLAPLLGLVLGSDEVALGDGLVLIRGEVAVDCPSPARRPRADGTVPVLARLSWEAAPGDEAPLGHAVVRLRRLVTALRLFDAAGVALGRTSWTRTGPGAWTAIALGPGVGGRVRGVCSVPPAQEDELRAFCSLVARRTPRHGEVAWALRRYELACERALPSETLTDVLLALRALLDSEGGGQLPARLAALCAVDGRQRVTAERVAHAIALERAVVAGAAPEEATLEPLVDELAGWLRALLRDVLCGHLDSDLRCVADELVARDQPTHDGRDRSYP